MAPSRNDPCPCGSGKKYKNCHLEIDEQNRALRQRAPRDQKGRVRWDGSAMRPFAVPPALAKKMRDEAARRANLGEVRPIVHSELGGRKLVIVGKTVHWSANWRTFIDFLFYYIMWVFGTSWGRAEQAKPPAQRHVILQWFQHLSDFRARHEADATGLKTGTPDGPVAAYIALAYDLYVVADSLLLQKSLVKRLKHPDLFQGARYELAVAATLIRAGCSIELEDETDASRKHTELTATHRRSGEAFAVEAKSRHRPGVLGFGGATTPSERFRLGITHQLREAKAKRGIKPLVVFVDANMPPEIARGETETWLQEFSRSVERVGHDVSDEGVHVGGPFAAIVLTNWADHYGEPGGALPEGMCVIAIPPRAERPLRDTRILADVKRAVQQFGVVPGEFPPH